MTIIIIFQLQNKTEQNIFCKTVITKCNYSWIDRKPEGLFDSNY